MIVIKENKLRMNKDGLRNTVPIHWTTLNSRPRRDCNDNRTAEAKTFKEQEPNLENDCDEGYNGTDTTYNVNNIVWHIGSGIRFRNLVAWYGYTKAVHTT